MPERNKKPKLKKEHIKKPKSSKIKSPKVHSKADELENAVIIGRTDTDEPVEVEVVDEQEYEAYRFNKWNSRKKYS